MKTYTCDICKTAYTKDLHQHQRYESGNWLKLKGEIYYTFTECGMTYSQKRKKTVHICPRCQRKIREYVNKEQSK